MKVAHLCFDGNFIESSISVFEHFYPNSNTWLIAEPRKGEKRKVKAEGKTIYWFNPYVDKLYVDKVRDVVSQEGVDKIVIHGITKHSLAIIKALFEKKKYTVYWIFWGFELYSALGESGKKKLVDNDSPWNPFSYVMPTKYRYVFWHRIINRSQGFEDVLKEALPYIDYFCFWLYEDYLLLKEFYSTSAKFKYFQYGTVYRDELKEENMEIYFSKSPHTIILNHQASSFGNHLTLMKRLRNIEGIDDYQIIVPLSYGARTIKKLILWRGKQFFGGRFLPIMDYMDLNRYQSTIGKAEIAIFGNLRQEAVGNISFLLACGTKVFLREGNVLYPFFKKLGYLVFSFEKDLQTIDDLKGLTLEQKRYNASIAASHKKCYEDFMPTLLCD